MLLLNNRGAVDGALRLAAVRRMRRGCRVEPLFRFENNISNCGYFLDIRIYSIENKLHEIRHVMYHFVPMGYF